MAEDDRPAQNPAGDRDVMGSLPRTRPARRSARRDAAAGKRAADATKAAATSGGGTKAKPRAKAKAGTGRTSPAAGQRHLRSTPPRKVPPAGYATPRAEDRGHGGGELVSTAAKAAGELAQVGVDVGRGVLKGALRRLSGR